ncbi:MAG: NAD(P)H-binding protein [Pseudomonadota bacterium]
MSKTNLILNPNQTVLVLGGNGFIGRHIVDYLERVGATVVIGTRGIQGKHEPGSRKCILQNIEHVSDWDRHLEGIDVVVNAVGILRQRFRETYEQVHYRAVACLVDACAKKRIRLVHISVLGLDNEIRSRFVTSKRRAEQMIQASHADWYLVRPSLVDNGGEPGVGGNGAKWFRRMAQWPVQFVPANAKGRIAPIHVRDLGEATARLALAEAPAERVYELGGDQYLTVLEYFAALCPRRPRFVIRVPAWLARGLSHVLDVLHLTPFSFGHYELLKYDNVPKINRLGGLLGRPARNISWAIRPQGISSLARGATKSSLAREK